MFDLQVLNAREASYVALRDLRLSGLRLCVVMEKSNSFSDSEREALFSTIGQIAYLVDAISLSLCVMSESDVPDFRSLVDKANELTSSIHHLFQ